MNSVTNCAPVFMPLANDISAEVDAAVARAKAHRIDLAGTTNNTVFGSFVAVFVGLVAVLLGGVFSRPTPGLLRRSKRLNAR